MSPATTTKPFPTRRQILGITIVTVAEVIAATTIVARRRRSEVIAATTIVARRRRSDPNGSVFFSNGIPWRGLLLNLGLWQPLAVL